MNARIASIIVLALPALAACQSGPQKIALAPGTGAITGIVTSAPHKDLIAKAKRVAKSTAANMPADDRKYFDASGKVKYTDRMINYDTLDELYVGLVLPGSRPPATHALTAREVGLVPRSVALAKGDKLRIENATKGALTFFVTDADGDEIIEFDPLAPGTSGEVAIDLEGPLEIATDEREDLTGWVLSRPGLAVRRVKSGARYTFKDLAPGAYDMVFWYWRLGSLEHRAEVTAGAVVEINERLSVDITAH